MRYYGKIHSQLPIFRVKSVKIYIGQKKFKYQVWSFAKSCSSFLTKYKPIFLNPAFEIFTSDGWGKSIPQDGEPEKPYLEAVRTTEDLSALSKIDLSHFIKLFPTRKYFPYQEIFCAAQLFKVEQNILSLK